MIRAILTALITMSVLSAQEVRGTFTGTVANPQGVIIVGAKVVARNLAIGSVTESVINEAGLLVAPFLPKGKYQITASNGQVIDSAKVKDLPLLGRNPFLLAAISTGVQYSPTRGFKKFAVTERVNVEFRAESFNMTNTPYFGGPNLTEGGAAFATVTPAQVNDPRNIQFALRLAF